MSVWAAACGGPETTGGAGTPAVVSVDGSSTVFPVTEAVAEEFQKENQGMQVMVGCMTESSVGISAIAHLVPSLDYVDMDGALLLAEDPATGVLVTPQGLIFPEENGTGVPLCTPGTARLHMERCQV